MQRDEMASLRTLRTHWINSYERCDISGYQLCLRVIRFKSQADEVEVRCYPVIEDIKARVRVVKCENFLEHFQYRELIVEIIKCSR